MMPIDNIPDWEKRLARQDAFWQREIIDRPVVVMNFSKPEPSVPWPAPGSYAAERDRWFDTQRVVENAVAWVMNRGYLGDALPVAWPNLGPEVFSAFFGMEMEYTRDTSWGIPNLEDWAEADKLVFSRDNFYWKKLVELTDALLEACAGKCYVGISDLHGGGDAVAAFRDPMALNFDMLEHRDDLKRLLARVDKAFLETYDFFHDKLRAAGQPTCTWAGIVSPKKWYVPSNDFSCMISKEMFDDVFLPGIARECRFYEASIYHVDGPDALRHLPSLLDIPELNAIQWVYGAGKGTALDWFPVYKQCQAAGKGIQLIIEADHVDGVIENLRPEGTWTSVQVTSREEAQAVLRKFEHWT